MHPRWREETTPGHTFHATKPRRSPGWSRDLPAARWPAQPARLPSAPCAVPSPAAAIPPTLLAQTFRPSQLLWPLAPSSPCPRLTPVTFHREKSVQKFLRCLWALAALPRSRGVSQPPGGHSHALCCDSCHRFCPPEYLKSNKNTNICILDTSQPRPYLSYLALLLELGPEEAPNDLGYLTCCA